MRIICDSSALIEPKDMDKYGIKVLPLNVTINGKTFREFVEIDRKTFLDMIRAGGIPTSSQPSVGEVMDAYEESDEDTLVITMADGLSGTYQTFAGVKQSMENKADHITVINSRTLAGPETLLVEKAIRMRAEGKTKQEIVDALQYSMDRHISFLIPQDFDFLLRGGRLTPIAAKIGGLIKIVPVLKTSADSKILEKFAVKRTVKSAIADIAEHFKSMGVDKDYTIYLCHADCEELAEKIKSWLAQSFPETSIKIMELSPVFVTQGGPGCCSVQVIHN